VTPLVPEKYDSLLKNLKISATGFNFCFFGQAVINLSLCSCQKMQLFQIGDFATAVITFSALCRAPS
jgi:hypothetical protein